MYDRSHTPTSSPHTHIHKQTARIETRVVLSTINQQSKQSKELLLSRWTRSFSSSSSSSSSSSVMYSFLRASRKKPTPKISYFLSLQSETKWEIFYCFGARVVQTIKINSSTRKLSSFKKQAQKIIFYFPTLFRSLSIPTCPCPICRWAKRNPTNFTEIVWGNVNENEEFVIAEYAALSGVRWGWIASRCQRPRHRRATSAAIGGGGPRGGGGWCLTCECDNLGSRREKPPREQRKCKCREEWYGLHEASLVRCDRRDMILLALPFKGRHIASRKGPNFGIPTF
jgi:hypothetical protein